MSVSRSDFSLSTKRKIAERAGLRCSFLSCGRITAGPGHSDSQVSNSGVAAHIFSASVDGPRGQNNLTVKQLKDKENAIWLCADCARKIDNNDGTTYSAGLLQTYRKIHEARIALEHEGLYSPRGWLFELLIEKSPLIIDNYKLVFGKMTVLLGRNGTGKTAICEWIKGIFYPATLTRWKALNADLRVQLIYYHPNQVTIGYNLTIGDKPPYIIDGCYSAINTVNICIISPKLSSESLSDYMKRKDDLSYFMDMFSLDPAAILSLVNNVLSFQNSKLQHLAFEASDNLFHLRVRFKGKSSHLLPFAMLSHGEQEVVIIEVATALARESSKYSPTMLILDGIYHIHDKWFENLSHHFLDPVNQFQTILTSPLDKENLPGLSENGWTVIELNDFTERKLPIQKSLEISV